MVQVIDASDKEQFEMYNVFEKEVLIRMLIEKNKYIERLTTKIKVIPCFYMAGNDTSGRCTHCGKQKWEH